MRGSIVFYVILGLLLLAGAGFLALGAFPPEPKTQTIQTILPNERFQPKG